MVYHLPSASWPNSATAHASRLTTGSHASRLTSHGSSSRPCSIRLTQVVRDTPERYLPWQSGRSVTRKVWQARNCARALSANFLSWQWRGRRRARSAVCMHMATLRWLLANERWRPPRIPPAVYAPRGFSKPRFWDPVVLVAAQTADVRSSVPIRRQLASRLNIDQSRIYCLPGGGRRCCGL